MLDAGPPTRNASAGPECVLAGDAGELFVAADAAEVLDLVALGLADALALADGLDGRGSVRRRQLVELVHGDRLERAKVADVRALGELVPVELGAVVLVHAGDVGGRALEAQLHQRRDAAVAVLEVRDRVDLCRLALGLSCH